MKFVKSSANNKEYSKVLSEWNFKLGDKLVRVNGRVLDNEKIIFGQRRTVTTDHRAQWDIRNCSLYEGVEIKNWCVIYPRRAEKDVDNFFK